MQMFFSYFFWASVLQLISVSGEKGDKLHLQWQSSFEGWKVKSIRLLPRAMVSLMIWGIIINICKSMLLVTNELGHYN